MGLASLAGTLIFPNLDKATTRLGRTRARIASGIRLASAADNPSDMGISVKLKSRVRALKQCERNIQDAISLSQVAEAGLASIVAPPLQRMRELLIQAANSHLSDRDRESIQIEINSLISTIDKIASTTEFNEIPLLHHTAVSQTQLWIQSGADSGDGMILETSHVTSSALGLVSVSVATVDDADSSIALVDRALQLASSERGKWGAYQNRLEKQSSLASASANLLTEAVSVYTDADIALEASRLVCDQLLLQAPQAMLSHAFESEKGILKLLSA